MSDVLQLYESIFMLISIALRSLLLMKVRKHATLVIGFENRIILKIVFIEIGI